MDPNQKFLTECKERVQLYEQNSELLAAAQNFMKQLNYAQYCFNFTWLGRPVLQLPQDLYALQELIWQVKPDLIIETGIAHGGSLIFSASMLELLGGDGEVLGLDIDIRDHNREAIEAHPMFKRITMFEGDSTSAEMAAHVSAFANGKKRVLVCLDSNHTHAHVLRELEHYAPLVTVGSYCVVFDTGIEDLPDDLFSDRPWGKGNSPKTAIWEFLKHHDEFEIDKSVELKLLITAASDGWLKRVK